MSQPSRAAAVAAILAHRAHPDLAASYSADMECQVNVGQDGGRPSGEFNGRKGASYTDGAQTWYSFRMPKGTRSDDPQDNTGLPMTFDSCHVEGIGMTGWCWRDLRSRWVAFDFDAIVGHSEKHSKRLSNEELAAVMTAAQAIPWVEVRRSASGSGLHLYVRFAEHVPTKSHTEHAALARAVLAAMSAAVGFDFCSSVDVCGGNMWVWHRKSVGTNGLSLVKAGVPMAPNLIPPDWRSHVKVITGQRKKALPSFVAGQLDGRPDADASFDEMAGQHNRVSLDAEHKRLIEWLQSNGACGWWDADHHMLVTHTLHLKRAHAALQMRGHFETSSPGSEPGEQNCFLFPMRKGAWSVRRYTPGAEEHHSWEQDGKGFTKCYLNRDPNLKSASRAAGGVESENGGFMFREAATAAAVARTLGSNVEVPSMVAQRPARLKPHKDGKRLILELDHGDHDSAPAMVGFYVEKGKWKRVIDAPLCADSGESEIDSFDDDVRHAVTESKMDAGWFIRVDQSWHHEPKAHVGLALLSLGKKKAEADAIMGTSVRKPWTIVSRPFDDEYPGDRLWNKSLAKFRYPRSDDPGPYPHWQRLLDHIGAELDDYVRQNGWAAANGITRGSDYLKLWYASMLQFPYEPLPYLFLWGPQNCGKSSAHEMIDLLISGGIAEANQIFEKDEKVNSILEGSVLVVIEEMDLNKNKKAYERIKTWVTSPKVTIRKMYVNPYEMPNTTHWIHTANSHTACPIFPGDTRIVVIHVKDLPPEQMIPKPEFKELLRREAPHFLSMLLNLEVPRSNDRLRIPVISSADKEALAQANRTSVEEFIDLFAHCVPGETMPFAEFYEKFIEWLPPHEQHQWTKHKVSKELPPQFPSAKRGGHATIGNISWTARDPLAPPKPRLVVNGQSLVPVVQ